MKQRRLLPLSGEFDPAPCRRSSPAPFYVSISPTPRSRRPRGSASLLLLPAVSLSEIHSPPSSPRILSFPGGAPAVSDGVTAMEEESPLSLSLRRCEHRRRAALLHAPSPALSLPSTAVQHCCRSTAVVPSARQSHRRRRPASAAFVEIPVATPSDSPFPKLSPLPFPLLLNFF